MTVQYTPDLNGILREVFLHGPTTDRLYVQNPHDCKAPITRLKGSYIRLWDIRWDISHLSVSLPVTAVRRVIFGVTIRVRYPDGNERYLGVEERGVTDVYA